MTLPPEPSPLARPAAAVGAAIAAIWRHRPGLALAGVIALAGCAERDPDPPPAAAADRLAAATEVSARLDPVIEAAGAVPHAGPDDSFDDSAAGTAETVRTAWSAALRQLDADAFPQGGAALLFQCKVAFREVLEGDDLKAWPPDEGLAVERTGDRPTEDAPSSTIRRLRTCRADAWRMANEARRAELAMAYGKLGRYAAAALEVAAAGAARTGRSGLARALRTEARAPVRTGVRTGVAGAADANR